MIFLNLLIPLIAILIMLAFFRKNVSPLEYGLIFGIPLAIIGICYAVANFAKTTDIEYLSSYGVTGVYEEAWDEEVSCDHPIYRTDTDSDGNTSQVYVGDEHMYDVDDHYERWYIKDNTGQRWSSNRSHFEQLCTRWGSRKFKDMNRDYHSRDGDAYTTLFNGKFEDMEDYCKTKRYKNKVQASDSVFNEMEVDEDDIELYGLHEYRKTGNQTYNPIYGLSNAKASHKLQCYNSLNGFSKQLTMVLCVYRNQPFDAGELQESLWKGGNKNEFIVCVGLSGADIDWVKVISWTEVDILKQTTCTDIKAMGKFDADQVVTYMGTNIPKTFSRKEFADFEYITVQPSGTAQMVSMLLTLFSTVGVCIASYYLDIRLK
jgi:hypothetical protein